MVAFDDIVQIMKQAGLVHGDADVQPDVTLVDQGFDSFDRMMLLFELVQHLGVEIPNQDAKLLKTPADIVNYINTAKSG